MAGKRLEWKVGLFVFVGLTLLAVLLLQFSKGTTLFRDTYELRMRAEHVGGLRTRAAVLMSGVRVGDVSDIRLAPDGKSVTIFLRIYGEYEIRDDARFLIQQSGFLGDQYVGIVPTENVGRVLRNNDEIIGEAPFDLQAVARSAAGFVERVDETAAKLNEVISDVRRLVLNEETLTNLSATAANMRVVSEHALSAVDNINALVETNSPLIGTSVSNIVLFSEQLNEFTDTFSSLISTNAGEITAAVQNLEASSAVLKSMMDDVNAGKGLAGTVLRNDILATNVALIAHNLAITSSNLNRLGLWGIFRAQRQPRPAGPPPQSLPAPNDPFQ